MVGFYRDTWVEVNLDHIAANVRSMKAWLRDDVEIMAVVKANAYGHGDYHVAETALQAGATQLATAFFDEALSLRQRGINAPILVLGVIRPEEAKLASLYNITVTVADHEWLSKATEYLDGNSLSIHLKLDTGMGRLGLRSREEVIKVLESLTVHTNIKLEGAFTHYATADEPNNKYFHEQSARFTEMLAWLPTRPAVIHCANSATALRDDGGLYNMIRLGIVMYGLSPSEEMKGLLPFKLQTAFSLYSKLVHVKKVKAGDKISYGATYTANEDEWIGTVPIGYADGWLRKMQGFSVVVADRPAPIVGRVCMDQCMIKLPQNLPIGTKVTLISNDEKSPSYVDEVAKHLDTINYEIPCSISFRVPRMFFRNMSIMDVSNPILEKNNDF
ncbi:alanine racemase [Bacillus sp. HMF5848]|uniref:alanine racemase n=1 Tax=Bacillus sp. HMF5848 TaxID=2495421 RepID=UPI000F79658E|nr:alanine racemase [Bacillus sp. HMF5848]RSK25664.1 alanine racemase [Bacillus sp. HMF5848]